MRGGFSLLTTLIAFAGFSVLALSIAEYSSMGVKVTKNASLNQDIINLREEINIVLQDQSKCTPVFESVRLLPGRNPPVGDFVLHNISGQPLTMKNLTITPSIVELVDDTEGGCTSAQSECTYIARLAVEVIKRGGLGGPAHFGKLLYMTTEGEDPGTARNILSCSSKSESGPSGDSETVTTEMRVTMVWCPFSGNNNPHCYYKETLDSTIVNPPGGCGSGGVVCKRASMGRNDLTCHPGIMNSIGSTQVLLQKYDQFQGLFPSREITSIQLTDYEILDRGSPRCSIHNRANITYRVRF